MQPGCKKTNAGSRLCSRLRLAQGILLPEGRRKSPSQLTQRGRGRHRGLHRRLPAPLPSQDKHRFLALTASLPRCLRGRLPPASSLLRCPTHAGDSHPAGQSLAPLLASEGSQAAWPLGVFLGERAGVLACWALCGEGTARRSSGCEEEPQTWDSSSSLLPSAGSSARVRGPLFTHSL